MGIEGTAMVKLAVFTAALLGNASTQQYLAFAYHGYHDRDHDDIQRQCSPMMYPSLCVQSLQEFGYGVGSLEFVSLLLNETISHSHHLLFSFSLQDFQDTSLHFVSSASCERYVKMSTKRLSQAMEALNHSLRSKRRRRYIKVDDIKTWLSAAMTFQQACKDSVDVVSASAGISQKMDHLSRLVSNSLALVDRIKVKSKSSAAFPWRISAGDRRLVEARTAKIRAHAVVAKDGSGDFRTVSEAVAAATTSGKGRFVIYVKAGIYKEKINIDKDGITMIGEGKDQTVIVGGDSVAGGSSMPDSATCTITGDRFIGRDIGFKNTAGPRGQQAVALSIASDQSVLYRCSISGYQDTLYTVALRQFYRECDIYGTVDFIFGNSAAIFQSCNLVLRRPNDIRAYNVILASGRTDPRQNTGFSLQNCKITADVDFSAVRRRYRSYLGRPWKPYSRCVVMDSYIDDTIAREGWIDWLSSESTGDHHLKTLYFGEYKNYGGGAAAMAERVKWEGFHVLGFQDAMKFSVAEFIDGISWLPTTGISFTSGI